MTSQPMTASFAKVVAESIGFNQADGPHQPLLLQRDPAERRRRAPGRRRDDRRAELQGVLVPLVGFAGEAQNFDGNGQYTRVQTGGGAEHRRRATKLPGTGSARLASCSATRSCQPLGTRPTHPDKKPPYKPDSACYKNKRPDLNGPAAAAGPADDE